jgi:hypothetical protein
MDRSKGWGRFTAVGIPLVLAFAAGCDSGSGGATCTEGACSGRGACLVAPGGGPAYCACDPGYHPDGLTCVADDPGDPCRGVDCSGHGTCAVPAALPRCTCDAGYAVDPSGLHCLAGSVVPLTVPAGTRVDLLVVLDNSGSMVQEQAVLAEQFPAVILDLVSPPDVDGDGRPDHAAAEDLHVGFVSTDMGTMGLTVPTCANSARGDDGCLRNDPYGSLLPSDCPRYYPTFLGWNAEGSYPAETLARDFSCLAGLGTNGCGFEQHLKAAEKALRDNTRPGGCNAGFLRSDSLLVVLFVTDEDDCSVDPAHPEMFDTTLNPTLGPINVRCFRNPGFVESVAHYVDAFAAVRAGARGGIVLGFVVGVPADVAACNGYGDEIGRCLDLAPMVERPDPTGESLMPSCDTPMGRAYPPVRLVQLAQAWGRNGVVGSICSPDWSAFLGRLTNRMHELIVEAYSCLPSPVPFDRASCASSCAVVEVMPPWALCEADPACPSAGCPEADPGDPFGAPDCRNPTTGAACRPLHRPLGFLTGRDGTPRAACLLRQSARLPEGGRCGRPIDAGWFHTPSDWVSGECDRIGFAGPGGDPIVSTGTTLELRCR